MARYVCAFSLGIMICRLPGKCTFLLSLCRHFPHQRYHGQPQSVVLCISFYRVSTHSRGILCRTTISSSWSGESEPTSTRADISSLSANAHQMLETCSLSEMYRLLSGQTTEQGSEKRSQTRGSGHSAKEYFGRTNREKTLALEKHGDKEEKRFLLVSTRRSADKSCYRCSVGLLGRSLQP
ncbi:hypothetical protein BDV19DRAFT_233152 [Aspergillus venezuelensis]